MPYTLLPPPVDSLDHASEFHSEVLNLQDAFQWQVEALSSCFALSQPSVPPSAPLAMAVVPYPTQDVAEDPFVACPGQPSDLPDDLIPDLFPDGASHEDFISSLPVAIHLLDSSILVSPCQPLEQLFQITGMERTLRNRRLPFSHWCTHAVASALVEWPGIELRGFSNKYQEFLLLQSGRCLFLFRSTWQRQTVSGAKFKPSGACMD